MNTDHDFEKQLQRPALRKIPVEWRAEILDAARAATPAPRRSEITFRALLSAFGGQLSSLLWPHPKAWATLAAIWLGILSMNFYAADPPRQLAKNDVLPSPEFLVAIREQRRELAKLIEPNVNSDVNKPRSLRSGPRTECRNERLAA
jgi:hypothetical protein